MTRVAVLEAKVKLISLVLKGTVAVLISSFAAYLFKGLV
jgi:hypothetical protein